MGHYHQVIKHVDQDVQYALRCFDHNAPYLSVVTMSLDTTFIFEIWFLLDYL